MTLLNAVNVTVDSLDAIAGDLLALEATVSIDPVDTEQREHIKGELAAARRRLLLIVQLLHDERRLGA